jgi:hypothetical protein
VLERDVGAGDIEGGWVDRAGDPLEEIVVVFVSGISRGEQQLLVASSAATVLRRARVGTVEAHGVLQPVRERLAALNDDFVVPTVAEVVLVRDPAPPSARMTVTAFSSSRSRSSLRKSSSNFIR